MNTGLGLATSLDYFADGARSFRERISYRDTCNAVSAAWNFRENPAGELRFDRHLRILTLRKWNFVDSFYVSRRRSYRRHFENFINNITAANEKSILPWLIRIHLEM